MRCDGFFYLKREMKEKETLINLIGMAWNLCMGCVFLPECAFVLIYVSRCVLLWKQKQKGIMKWHLIRSGQYGIIIM